MSEWHEQPVNQNFMGTPIKLLKLCITLQHPSCPVNRAPGMHWQRHPGNPRTHMQATPSWETKKVSIFIKPEPLSFKIALLCFVRINFGIMKDFTKPDMHLKAPWNTKDVQWLHTRMWLHVHLLFWKEFNKWCWSKKKIWNNNQQAANYHQHTCPPLEGVKNYKL